MRNNDRKLESATGLEHQLNVLLLEQDEDYALFLKQFIESHLPVSVTLVHTTVNARRVLTSSPKKFFIGITSVLNVETTEFDKVNLLGEFQVPVIAIVNEFEDEMRDQLIKHHVIDYVVKDNQIESTYICDLISRIHKNRDITVLVVDDSKVSRFVIVRELILQQFKVLEAENGVEALALLQTNPDIKLVLVDNQMPNMDGYTFVSKARELYSKDQLSIIGLSTSNEARLTVKFLKAGANDFIVKPFNYEILLCRITQNLDMLDAVDYAKKLAYTDYLSGVNNRRYFFEQGEKVMHSAAAEEAFTVMMFDIDFFKKINDQFGHDVGDRVIKNFASLLRTHFAEDIVARIGGEEFAVISTSTEYLFDLDYVDRFRALIEKQTLSVDDRNLKFTCSIGVCNIKGKSLDAMLRQADTYLYQAKLDGRNQIQAS